MQPGVNGPCLPTAHQTDGANMNTAYYIDLGIDLVPFALYVGLLIKLLLSWLTLKEVSQEHRSPAAAVLLLTCLVIVLFIASNIYTLGVYGKTFLSIRVFQMFVVGNCVVYWVLIEMLVRSIRRQAAMAAVHAKAAEGVRSELAD